MKKQLIIGIDPGTTTAYAILDTYGRLIAVDSSKDMTLDRVLRETTSLGLPLLVGTDRKKCPGMVIKYAARTGAIKAVPLYDMTEVEKNAMTKGMPTTNAHQKDAIAAAFVAYRQYEPLLSRIDKFLAEEGKTEVAEQVKNIVLHKKISMKKALAIIVC